MATESQVAGINRETAPPAPYCDTQFYKETMLDLVENMKQTGYALMGKRIGAPPLGATPSSFSRMGVNAGSRFEFVFLAQNEKGWC